MSFIFTGLFSMVRFLQKCLSLIVCIAATGYCLPADSLPAGGWIKAEGGTTSPCLRVLTVIPGEALDTAGIKPGDRITGCDSCVFSSMTNDVRAWFKRHLSRLDPNETVLLYTLRNGTMITCTYTRTTMRPLKANGIYHSTGHCECMARPKAALHKRVISLLTYPVALLSRQPVSEDPLHSILEDYAGSPVIPVVATQLITSAVIRQDAWHTPIIDHVMQNPGDIITCGKQYAGKTTSELQTFLHQSSTPGTTVSFSFIGGFIESVSNVCIQVMNAFPSTGDAARVAAQLTAVMDQVDTWFYLHDDTNSERFAASHDVISSALEFDPAAIDTAFNSLVSWCRKLNRESLLACINTQYTAGVSANGCTGILLAVYPTPWGEIVIGGPGNNRYDAAPLAVIDVGGDDTYTGRAAIGPEKPVSLTIDYGGNDMYTATNDAAIAAGVCGIGIVIDHAGNDIYSVQRWGIGAGYFGRGLLIDYEGNDRYIGKRFVQGVGLFGKGILFDVSGNDTYIGLRFAQGVGFPGGEGTLYDLSGNDLYFATLGSGSEYGTPGIYSGMSQGFGTGFRLMASGGIGSLIDMGGNDRYESGNFSQGGGYYLGFGILYDHCGDDSYQAMRYCQGFAAHTAAGALIDKNGNDTYAGTVTANQGLAWDHSVAGFHDCNGNDTYTSKGLALGAACINSYAEFFDGQGTDTYTFSGRSAAGHSRSRDGSTNIAIFCDCGGDNDRYDSRGRLFMKNDIIQTNAVIGIFIDK
jgi:hypothetical protein